MFVLFAATSLLNQTIGKPYQSQDQDETVKLFSEEGLVPSRGENETVVIRSKRQALTSSNGCVNRWLYRPNHGVYEAECKIGSFACLSSITTTGVPKCNPVYKTVNNFRFIANCLCA